MNWKERVFQVVDVDALMSPSLIQALRINWLVVVCLRPKD